MAEMLAYCGLDCSGCPIRTATGVKDLARQTQMREDIARQIEKLYGMKCTAEDITDCDGCRMDEGRLFVACAMCNIRKCAREKVVENCAHCGEYVCEKLQGFFDHGGKLLNMDAKARLDVIREALGNGS
jgi:hypothetical protein